MGRNPAMTYFTNRMKCQIERPVKGQYYFKDHEKILLPLERKKVVHTWSLGIRMILNFSSLTLEAKIQ